jgi:hypothetical protein
LPSSYGRLSVDASPVQVVEQKTVTGLLIQELRTSLISESADSIWFVQVKHGVNGAIRVFDIRLR